MVQQVGEIEKKGSLLVFLSLFSKAVMLSHLRNPVHACLMSISIGKLHESESVSCVSLFVTLWTIARQAPLSVGFSRQEYPNGLPFPPPWDIPEPGIEPTSPSLQADC